jgi:hypothetical protein
VLVPFWVLAGSTVTKKVVIVFVDFSCRFSVIWCIQIHFMELALPPCYKKIRIRPC